MSDSRVPGRGGPGIATVILVSVFTSAAVSVGIAYASANGWIVFGAPVAEAPRDEEVPSLRGLSLEAARGVLDARGLRLVHRGEQNDEAIAAGNIVSQQPRSLSRVPRNSEVTVVVSLGAELVTVPDVFGLQAASARGRLTGVGLAVAAELRPGGEGAPGTVTATIPAGGQRVARGTEVSLVAVPQPRLIAVPNLVGTSSRAARELIVQTGLVVGQVRSRFDDNRGPYVVLQQTPAAGTQVAPGTAIELVVNEGD